MQQQPAQREPWSLERAAAVIAGEQHRPGACLPVLQALQETFGHVPDAAVPLVAEALNLSRAEVHGVLTFYHDFRREPAGRCVVKLCRAEACQAVGADALAAELQRRLGLRLGETSADGRVTLEPVFCLGNCACGPAALIDGKLQARLDAERVLALVAAADRPKRTRP